MKKNTGIYTRRGLFLVASLMLAFAIAICGVMTAGGLLSNKAAYAEAAAEPAADPSPAVYVAQKNAASVVGVITNTQQWDRSSGEVKETMYAQGSGVVIKEGDYVLTNYHVIESGDSYQILMPDGSPNYRLRYGQRNAKSRMLLCDFEARKRSVKCRSINLLRCDKMI